MRQLDQTTSLCAICRKHVNLTYRAYLKNIKINENFICRKCATSKFITARNISRTGTYKHSRIDNFFEIPNKLNSYWAGFIAADGCIWAGTNTLAIKINNRDRLSLEKFKTDIQYTGIIGEIASQDQCRLTLNSAKICKDLFDNFNITSNKSLTMLPPNLTDDELIKSFIVGYIDGDGSICRIGPSKYLKLSICGTFETLFWILQLFDKWSPKTKATKQIQHVIKDKNVYELIIYGKRAESLITTLSNSAVYKFPRKWDKILKEIENKRNKYYVNV